MTMTGTSETGEREVHHTPRRPGTDPQADRGRVYSGSRRPGVRGDDEEQRDGADPFRPTWSADRAGSEIPSTRMPARPTMLSTGTGRPTTEHRGHHRGPGVGACRGHRSDVGPPRQQADDADACRTGSRAAWERCTPRASASGTPLLHHQHDDQPRADSHDEEERDHRDVFSPVAPLIRIKKTRPQATGGDGATQFARLSPPMPTASRNAERDSPKKIRSTCSSR